MEMPSGRVCVMQSELTSEEKTAVGGSTPARYHYTVTGLSGRHGMMRRGLRAPKTGCSHGHHIALSDNQAGDWTLHGIHPGLSCSPRYCWHRRLGRRFWMTWIPHGSFPLSVYGVDPRGGSRVGPVRVLREMRPDRD